MFYVKILFNTTCINHKSIDINKKVLDRALQGNYIALPIPPWWPFLGRICGKAAP